MHQFAAKLLPRLLTLGHQKQRRLDACPELREMATTTQLLSPGSSLAMKFELTSPPSDFVLLPKKYETEDERAPLLHRR